jgi:hypothetical protein
MTNNTRHHLLPSMLLTAMALGTGWAIRGSFGHEQGAAWAGAIGALAIILVAKRQDWYQRFLAAGFAAAAGYGVTGIISYGKVVGYGAGIDFGNVYYGFLMLFVIGALFGWLGGGLFALALEDRKSKPVNWPALIVEMTCGGLIVYFFLVREFEWLMTPPRGEEWAACLGMGLALSWYCYRQEFRAPLRVAFFSAIGAGFGFAFGNFLQVMGRSAAITGLNLWNVMEYSIGFCGGLGLAYGVFTSQWSAEENPVEKKSVLTPLLFLGLLIPFFVWDQSFNLAHMDGGTPSQFIVQWVSLALVFLFAAFAMKKYYAAAKDLQQPADFKAVFVFFLALLIFYIIFHILISDTWVHGLSIEQGLYLLNLAGLIIFLPKFFATSVPASDSLRKQLVLLGLIVLVLAVLAMIAIHAHGPVPNMQKRFE